MSTQSAASEFDKQAADFLAKYGITVSIRRKDPHGPGPAPEWATNGIRGIAYKVTLRAEGRKPVSFDYWGSKHDMDRGVPASEYDVLACISGELHCPEKFEEWCSEFGEDEDSCRAYANWERGLKHSRKLQAFFPEGQEREDLSEIQ